jgi:peroxiredoxin Q/BCP
VPGKHSPPCAGLGNQSSPAREAARQEDEERKAISLTIGQPAPDFTAPADGGGELTLSALKGRKVVLYFYPKDDTPGCTKEACGFREDDTPGCTKEACGFRDALPDFSALDAEIVGVSKDSVAKHDKFKTKYDLPFRLVSDADGAICAAYGTWVEKSMYGHKYMGIDRATFLIDEAGALRAEWRKVKVPGHVAEVLQAARAL